MKYKVDLHVHSKHSGDNYSEPEESVLKAISAGLHGIAFTEHYSYAASEPAERLKEKYGDSICILRGVEFSALEGHCLVFGVDTDKLSLKYAPVAELINIVNAHGGVVIPSHPYRGGNSLGDKIMDLNGVCAIEGYNGCNMHIFNKKALKMAKTLQLPYTGGSDAHAPEEVGSCYTEFTTEVSEHNFIYLLKTGRYHGVDVRKISRLWPF